MPTIPEDPVAAKEERLDEHSCGAAVCASPDRHEWTRSDPPVINAERLPRDFIAIGGSAGSVGVVSSLLAALPADLPAGVAIVLHRSPFVESQLAAVLGRRALVAVVEPEDGHPVQAGVVYVAPRDQHMTIKNGLVRLNRGPKVHRTRPAIDPLFRSAAETRGKRVVGVLLSGMGSDGVSGLIAIKRAGGISLVQSLQEALFPSMPARALAEHDIDAMLDVQGLAKALVHLARGESFDGQPGGAAGGRARSA